MRHLLAVAGALTLATTVPAAAQDSLPQPRPLPIEAKKLIPHRDSMVVLVNNQPLGTSVWGVQKQGDSLEVHELTIIGSTMRQETTVGLTKKGEPLRVTQTGMIRDVQGGIDIRYAGNRVTGNVTAVSAEGPNKFTVDTTVPDGTVDDNSVQALLSALPWQEGAGWNFWMYSAGTNSVSVMALFVVGQETAMVPAGAFEAWRVRLTGGATSVDFLVLKRAPHTLLKIEMSGAPLKYELVSGGGL
ncbi:MAG TPA: hypothetical protein PLI70_02870 [Gemmatimonadales bacterium]|nr:hypothetical protein [Gemmatimonadales bacterium]